MNYGASLTDMYHQVGAYSVRILKGANPRTLFPHQRCPPSANRQEGERAGAVPSSSATRRRPSRYSAFQGAMLPMLPRLARNRNGRPQSRSAGLRREDRA